MNTLKTVLLAAMVLAMSAAPCAAQTLSLERTAFAPGEAITVVFSGAGDYPDNAWVGIVPSDVDHGREAVNDQYDIDYKYLRGQASGRLVFTAPAKPGRYDFRMHDTDNSGREVAYVSFSVTASAKEEPAVGASLRLDKTVFAPEEKATVQFIAPAGFKGNAWVGIIPSEVARGSESVNDRHDLAYQYLKGRTSGTLIFTVPSGPGDYDFRMHDTDDNGREVAAVSFSVTPGGKGAWLELEKDVFSPFEEIRVDFSAPNGLPGNAWVGIIPSRVAHGSETVNDQHDLTYQYLKGRTGGVLVFAAPSEPGDYDFRVHDTDDNGQELTSISFRVEK